MIMSIRALETENVSHRNQIKSLQNDIVNYQEQYQGTRGVVNIHEESYQAWPRRPVCLFQLSNSL